MADSSSGGLDHQLVISTACETPFSVQLTIYRIDNPQGWARGWLWQDPPLHNPRVIFAELREERISATAARDIFGDGRQIDIATTAATH